MTGERSGKREAEVTPVVATAEAAVAGDEKKGKVEAENRTAHKGTLIMNHNERAGAYKRARAMESRISR